MKFQETQVVAFVNQKGGCGKTSATVSTAAAFAELGYKASVVDTDPQCNTTESFGVDLDAHIRKGGYTLVDAYLKRRPAKDLQIDFGERFHGNLTVVPGHKGLRSVRARLESEMQAELSSENSSILDADDIQTDHRLRLRASLDSLRGQKDVVFIDTPPDLDFLMTTALIAADWFIIPIFPSGYDLSGLEALMQAVEKVRKRYNPTLRLAGVLLGNYDQSAKLDKDIYKLLTRKFGPEYVFDTTIGRSVKHREATVYRQTIFEHAPDHGAGDQYISLAREMINRGQKTKVNQTTRPLPPEDALQRVANG
jgi:chromosome partitioning protein